MKRLIEVSILSISLLVILSGTAISPALAEINETFSNIDPIFIKMILTLPSLVLIPFSLLSGKISVRIKKKRLLIWGLAIYLIGGVGGGIYENIYVLLFFRAILGVGLGLLLPLSTSLIADFFVGDERTKMMGYSNAVSNLGGIFATLVSGWLATIHWRYVFSTYLIAVIVLILVLIGLPEPPSRRTYKVSSYFFNKEVIILAILSLLLNIAFFCVLTNMAQFIENENIGKSDSSGLAISFVSIGGFLGGLLLQKISYFFKHLKVPFGIGFMSVGFLVLSGSNSLFVVVTSTFFIGFGLGILKPLIFLTTTEVTPHFSNAFAISIVSSSIYLGKFLSPFVLSLVGLLFNNSGIRFSFLFVGLSLVFATFLSLLIIYGPISVFKVRYTK